MEPTSGSRTGAPSRSTPFRGPGWIAARLAIAYVGACVVETVVFFETTGGHADVPFTMFPDYLVVAPLVPVLVASNLRLGIAALEVVSTLLFLASFAALWLGTGALLRRAGALLQGAGRGP